jgi:hypothetical protein
MKNFFSGFIVFLSLPYTCAAGYQPLCGQAIFLKMDDKVADCDENVRVVTRKAKSSER